MPDRKEVVIQDLKLVYEYIRKEVHDIASCKCRMLDKVNDAIALLKEQEAVEPILKRQGRNKYYNYYVCRCCNEELFYQQNYCSECGRAVKWDD